MKNKRTKITQRQANTLLVQARIQPAKSNSCQAPTHQPSEQNSVVFWKIHWYQNLGRMIDLLQQGVKQNQVNQIIWDEACHEQDTIGVRIHSSIILCNACTIRSLNGHAGSSALVMAMVATQVTRCTFLLVSNRQTENAGIIVPFPIEIEEKDILKKLRESESFPIHFNG